MNSTLPARVRPVEPKPIAKDADRRQPQIARQLTHVGLLFLDQIGAGLGVLPTCKCVPERPHTATHAIASFNHRRLSRRAPRARARRVKPARPAPATITSNAVQVCSRHR